MFLSGHMDNRWLATAMFVKQDDDILTASVVSRGIQTVGSLCVAVSPVPVSTGNTGEVALIR
jgi:hypothetical protein